LHKYGYAGCQTPDLILPLFHSPALTQSYADVHLR
jgi:hypothetical protein